MASLPFPLARDTEAKLQTHPSHCIPGLLPSTALKVLPCAISAAPPVYPSPASTITFEKQAASTLSNFKSTNLYLRTRKASDPRLHGRPRNQPNVLHFLVLKPHRVFPLPPQRDESPIPRGKTPSATLTARKSKAIKRALLRPLGPRKSSTPSPPKASRPGIPPSSCGPQPLRHDELDL